MQVSRDRRTDPPGARRSAAGRRYVCFCARRAAVDRDRQFLGRHAPSRLQPGIALGQRELRLPTPEESLALGLAPDSVVLHLERVRTAGSVLMVIERAVLAAELLGGNLEFGASLYGALNATGICLVRALQRLRAELASELDAALLGIRSGDPVLHIECSSFSVEGRPFELTRSFYLGVST